MALHARPGIQDRRRWRRRGMLAALTVALALVLGVVGCSGDSALPDPNAARGRDQSTVILDRDGRVITRLYAEQNRRDQPLAKIPVALRQAVVATEDQRFYEHSGIDPVGIARALFNDIVLQRPSQGGSTITQQYVKNAFGSPEKTISRKVEEAKLAQEVEQRYSKDQILELYLNTIYFGHGAYGIESAAQTYFGKSASSLSLPESATIAGVIKSPGRYSPYLDPKAAKLRRDTVLGQMREQGLVTEKQYADAAASPIKTIGLKSSGSTAPYFVEWLKDQLGHQFDQSQLYRGGLTVRTTLDLRAQRAAEKAIADKLDQNGDPSAALVALKPKTGEIIAMVGGRDFKSQQFNVAVQGQGRQPGSAFKPFVLATAIGSGVSPEQTFPSGPATIDVGDTPWKVTGAKSGANPMRLRQATEKSVNSVFAQLIMKVGAKNVASTAERLGLREGIKPVPAIALGGLDTGVTPLEMADAYATLAANGLHAEPYGIVEVKDAGGAVLYSAKPKTDRALEAPVAYLTTDVLKGVITRGTAGNAEIGRPAAGKTGTTQDNRDAWFVGYTPSLAAAVWMGYPEAARSMSSVHGQAMTGGSYPAQIWAQFMRAALEGTDETDFQKPDGLKRVAICLDSGMAATPNCPHTGSGLFLTDTTVASCTVHARPTVPNLVGLSRQDALARLKRQKLPARVLESPVVDGQVDRVLSQSPAAGSSVTTKTVVAITVGVTRTVQKSPIAAFELAQSAPAGTVVALDGSKSTTRGRIVKWSWGFGGGSTSSGEKTVHSWPSAGTFDVTLEVTDDAGKRASATKSIEIR